MSAKCQQPTSREPNTRWYNSLAGHAQTNAAPYSGCLYMLMERACDRCELVSALIPVDIRGFSNPNVVAG